MRVEADADWLEAAIENVWSQTFADHEILVASRNPSATARQITQYLASQSGRVRVIDAGSLHHAPLCDMLLTQARGRYVAWRSEEHTSELQSLMRISYAVFCLKKNNTKHH